MTAISRAAVLSWLDEARAAAQGTPWGEQLLVDQIDALDVLLEPLHLELLRALRASGDPHAMPTGQGLVHRARWLAFGLKKMVHEQRARTSTGRPHRVATLFWPRELTHINAQLPVLRCLEGRGTSCGVLACQPKAVDHLRHRGVESVFTCGAWPHVVRVARQAGKLRARAAAAAPLLKLPLFRSGAQEVSLEPIWRATVCRLLSEVFESVANARSAIEQFQPAEIVIGNDITLHGRAAALVARNAGVRTAVLMHGNVTGDELHGRHVCDAVIVYGEAGRREMVRHGGDAARVLVCGAPYLDDSPRQSGQMDARLQARLQLGPQDRWILVATSGPGDRISHEHHRLVIENLLHLAAAMPDVHWVIKLHRKDRVTHYQSALQGHAASRIHVLPFGEPNLPISIFDWLQGCPLLLTGASTVAVEAMLLDVPVITMDFHREIHGVDFIDAGATRHVTDFAALAAAVAASFASPDSLADVAGRARQYLADAFYLLDGRSAERTADAIESLARQPMGTSASSE